MNAGADTGSRRGSLFLALFLLTFCTYASFFNGGGWNQNAHFALTRAIVERGTVQIDAYRWSTFDVSEHGGHVYANKAPGISLLAVPVYAALHATVDPEFRGTVVFTTIAAWLCSIAVCALPGALLVVWLARHLILAGAADLTAASVALSTGLASMLLPFSSMLFLHTASAFFLFMAWDLVVRERRPLVAGFAAGMAGLCNYLCIPLAAAVMALHIWRARDLRRTAIFVAGAAVPALVLLSYQLAAFGNPFATTLSTLPEHFTDDAAVGGIFYMPSLEALAGLTVSPYRGLFFSMPVLLWGLYALCRRAGRSADETVLLSMTLVLLLANASFNGWHAGSSYGPRYLIPLIPVLMVYAARVWDRFRWLRRAAIAWAACVAWLAVAVNPMVSTRVPNPVTDYLAPLFLWGKLSGRLERLPPYAWRRMLGHVSVNEQSMVEAAAYMIVPEDSPEAFWASFNIGELLFPGSALSALTLALLVSIGAALILRHAAQVERAG